MMSEPTQGRDAELAAALGSALARDPEALHRPEHLDALLGDLAPTLPRSTRRACSAAAAAGLADFLMSAPGASRAAAAVWLTARAPGLAPGDTAQAVSAFGAVLGLSLPTYPPAPTQAPDVPQGYQFAPTAARDVIPPAPGPAYPFPPTAAADVPAGAPALQLSSLPTPMPPGFPYESQPARRSRKPWIIAAVVAVLLAGAGVGVGLAVTGHDKKPSTAMHTKLAAPQHVTTMADGTGVMVSWTAVTGATSYHVQDRTGRLTPVTVTDTKHTFPDATGSDHEFVVVAMGDSMQMGNASAVAVWHGMSGPKPKPKPKPPATLSAPGGLMTMRKGYDVMVSWDAVDGAQQYRVYDGGAAPTTVTGTSYTAQEAIYAKHQFTIVAVRGSVTSARSEVATWAPRNELSAAEQALAYRLPFSAARPGSCESDASERSPQSLATIRCQPSRGARGDGPTTLFADQLRPGTMRAYERGSFGTAIQGAESDACFAGDVPDGGAHGWWYIGTDHTRLGDIVCFTGQNGNHVYAWTYDDDNVVVQIQGSSPTTDAGLHSWWKTRYVGLNQ